MRIGASKCVTASIRRGKVTPASDHSFGNDVIKALSEGKSYKYLGITQVFRAEELEVRESLRKAYFDRLNRIWKAPLSARNKIHASNVWAISLFRHFFSSPMKWTKIYLKHLDTTTRRKLRKHKGHYWGASVERLYLKGEMGGRFGCGLPVSFRRPLPFCHSRTSQVKVREAQKLSALGSRKDSPRGRYSIEAGKGRD